MINNNKTDQIYDNGVLLGVLLQITGLSIWEVQSIISGDIRLNTVGKNIRSLIINDADLRQFFAVRAIESGISIKVLNEAFNTSIKENEYKSNAHLPNFIFNQFNFSLKSSVKIRENLVKILNEEYRFTNNQTAILLDISPSTVAKILGESKNKNLNK